jgi:hypothetical protein
VNFRIYFRRLQLQFICLSIIPMASYAGIQVQNGLTHTHSGIAGNVMTGKIRIKNVGKKEERILIYKQDLSLSCNGSLEYSELGNNTRSSGNWIQTNVDETVIGINEEYDIIYTITIPNTPDLSGTFWNIIMIEGADPVKEEADKGMKVSSRIRYAVQMTVDVGTFQSPQLAFENFAYKKNQAGNQLINVQLANKGDFASKTKLILEIYGANGEKLKVIESQSKRLYPKKCNDFELELKDLPVGKYEGIVVADNGKDLFGANISITIP